MTTMKALTFSEYGDIDKVSVTQVPKPTINGDQVLIKVHAAALNPVDHKRIQGLIGYLAPEVEDEANIIGCDAAGVIEQVGDSEEAQKFKVGDEVYVQTEIKYRGKAIAEYVACDASIVAQKPKSLSFSEAAALPLAACTALQCLRKGGVGQGSKVFVTAGAGGVGLFVIQMAKLLGASEVVTTASPGVGTDLCTKFGADKVINYKEEKIEEVLKGGDFDFAFDCTNEIEQIAPIMKKGGKMVSIASMGVYDDLVKTLGELTPEAKEFFEANVPQNFIEAAKKHDAEWLYHLVWPSQSDLNEIAKWVDEGKLKVVIDTEADSLDNYKVALDKLVSGRSKGKCVIKIAE